jgi:hypothetical protein
MILLGPRINVAEGKPRNRTARRCIDAEFDNRQLSRRVVQRLRLRRVAIANRDRPKSSFALGEKNYG